jgi:hypothetical protein
LETEAQSLNNRNSNNGHSSYFLNVYHVLVLVLGKRRTPHTKEAHERYLMSKSLISRLAGREKMAQQLLSVGLALSSIWEKARARDRQREVAGDKGQWALFFKG